MFVVQSHLKPAMIQHALHDLMRGGLSRVRICSAYLSLMGSRLMIEAIEHNAPAGDSTNIGKTIVTSLDFGMTEPAALRMWHEQQAEVYVAGTAALDRGTLMPKAAFHPTVPYVVNQYTQACFANDGQDTLGVQTTRKGRSMTEFCKVDKADHIMTVTLNRPERLNALHPPANAELGEVFDDYAADDDMWVAIVTGAGRGFSAGNDLRYQAEGGERVATPRGFGGLTSRFDLAKPIYAAVNGVAMGGGFEIALACDIIIASENAVFALPEPKVGLAALAGGLQRLPRQIGAKRALGMILTGRHVSAAEGYDLGFVNAVVAHDKLMEETHRWVQMTLECAPLSIRASKDVVYRSLSMGSLEESMAVRYESVATLSSSQDFIEGPRAFSEKRPPNWQGR